MVAPYSIVVIRRLDISQMLRPLGQAASGLASALLTFDG